MYEMMLEELNKWIDKIKLSNILVIVEGKKDKAALNSLGIENVVWLNKPLYKIAEQIAEKCKKCMILTDLDKEGKQLYARLKKNLTRLGVQIDDGFRNFLFSETKLTHIQGLATYISNQLSNKKSKQASSS
jgi:5S rRNA maturation endonuclease (ribonuclease M5)